MKTIFKFALLTLASAGLSQAAVTISIKNYVTLGSSGVPILDSVTGTPILKTPAGGSISVGYFTGSFAGPGNTNWSTTFDFANATPATIKAGFTTFGTSTTFSQNGMFNTNIVATLPNNDTSFTGRTMFTLITNAATPGAGTAFAILSNGLLFPTVDAGGTGSATDITGAESMAVYGKIVKPLTTLQQPVSTNTYASGLQLTTTQQLVPEPSAALLGAIGALALLRRRRN